MTELFPLSSLQAFQKLQDYTLLPTACSEASKLGASLSSLCLLVNRKHTYFWKHAHATQHLSAGVRSGGGSDTNVQYFETEPATWFTAPLPPLLNEQRCTMSLNLLMKPLDEAVALHCSNSFTVHQSKTVTPQESLHCKFHSVYMQMFNTFLDQSVKEKPKATLSPAFFNFSHQIDVI